MVVTLTSHQALGQPICLNPDYLPQQPLYGTVATNQSKGPGWQLAATPFSLKPEQIKQLQALGPALWHFSQALNQLYFESLAGRAPAFVASWLNTGKPADLLQFSQQKRLRQQLPRMIRPDLLLTDTGFSLCEIDAVPGGMGFLAALLQAYQQSGFKSLITPPEGFVATFAATLQDVYQSTAKQPIAVPQWVVLMSDEASDYQAEMTWLCQALRSQCNVSIELIHPKQVALVRDQLIYTNAEGSEITIDGIYRFFELFDRPNIPHLELIQYAIKKQWVVCTPPLAPHLEEKLALALFHHPALQAYWQKSLSPEDRAILQQVIPPTWVLDPTPMPSQGVVAGLALDGAPVHQFSDLGQQSQRLRRWVIKPSGFSPLAWGSRGVTIGHDMAQTDWQTALNKALASFTTTPFVLQPFVNTAICQIDALSRGATGQTTIAPTQGRVRLCPYYMVQNNDVTLAGVLATLCPADKKIIHGMQNAILAPAALTPD